MRVPDRPPVRDWQRCVECNTQLPADDTGICDDCLTAIFEQVGAAWDKPDDIELS